jgi:hypothetical protein
MTTYQARGVPDPAPPDNHRQKMNPAPARTGAGPNNNTNPENYFLSGEATFVLGTLPCDWLCGGTRKSLPV